MNKGRPGGKLGVAKGALPGERVFGRKRALGIRPAGRGGPAQQAGGPEHHGLDASEDRNP
jgi:hypothetical protein